MTTSVRRIHQTTIENDADDVEPTAHRHGQDTLSRVVWFVAGVLLSVLALRFLLALLGANTANGFANFIYNISYPFVAPFFTLFSYDVRYGVSHVEIYTLFAMLIYALIAYAIVYLININRSETE